jgi:hypothetical protein
VKLTFSRIILVSPKKAPSSATGRDREREREREVSEGVKVFKSLQHQGQGQGSSNSSSNSNTPPMQFRKVPQLHSDPSLPVPPGPLTDPSHTQQHYSSSLSEYASRSNSRPDSGSKIRKVRKKTPGTVSSPQSDSLSSSRSPFASTDTAEFLATSTHRCSIYCVFVFWQ